MIEKPTKIYNASQTNSVTMAFEIFYALVTVLALVYAGISRYVQNKLIDKKEMEAIQKESRELTVEMDKAQKAKDKKKVDELLQKQMEFLPRMNKMMMGQFRPMFIILAVFLLLTAAVSQLDPTVKDDIRLNLTDNGKGCDRVAGDGIYSACYQLDPSNTNYGKWTVLTTMYDSGAALGHNESYFLYNPNSTNADTYVEQGVGDGIAVSTDKTDYMPNDTVAIYATPANMTQGFTFLFIPITPPAPLQVDQVQAVLSNGTYFRVDLPVTIPLVNVNRIYQAYTWFILVALVTNITLSILISQYQKRKKSEEDKNTKKGKQ